MTTEKRNQIEELIKADNGELAEELEKVEGRDDFIKVFAKHGVELTDSDADEMMKEIIPDELSDDDLEGVAGGVSWKDVKLGWGIGVRVGMVARMIYDKYKYNNPYKNYNWNNVITGKVGLKVFGFSI